MQLVHTYTHTHTTADDEPSRLDGRGKEERKGEREAATRQK